MKNTIKITLGIIGIAAIGVLLKTSAKSEAKIIENIKQKYAPEMAECWESVSETGGTCDLQIIYVDNGQTPVSAKVVKK